jgi:hypothetical protein
MFRLNAAIKIGLVCLFLINTNNLRAQFLSSDVVVTSGDYFKNQTAQMEWTIGELAVETYKGSTFLTQGFIQGSPVLLSSNQEVESTQVQSNIFYYPNPTTNILNIELPYYFDGNNIELIVFDFLGKEVSRKLTHTHINELPMSNFASGFYLIRINSNNQFIKQFKINKI